MGGVGIDHSSTELGGLADSERLRLDGWDGIGHCDLAGSERQGNTQGGAD